MRVLVDVIGNPSGAGGSQLHAQEVVRAWAEEFPQDELVVIGPRWVDTIIADIPSARRIPWPNRALPLRILGQQLAVPLVMRCIHPDALIVTVPVISVVTPAKDSYVFVHDWRHLSRPDEFSGLRRRYRHAWLAGVTRARVVFAVSAKTLDETRRLAPGATVVLAENGADHVRRWDATVRPAWLPADGLPHVVTLGHRNNKRPDLVIRALADLPSLERTRLIVLGAEGSWRAELERLAESLGVRELCLFPGYVDDAEYHYLVAHAAAVVMASTDEGFGLPAAEALALGIPVVATEDSGLDRVFGAAVTTASASPDALGSALVRALMGEVAPTSMPTWAGVVAQVRSTIAASSP